MGLGVEAQTATPRGADPSAHLGGSSNYKSGEPFGLMWRRFSCRLCLGMSDPVLREWRRSDHAGKLPRAAQVPPRGAGVRAGTQGSPRFSKGMLVNIPATYAAQRGRGARQGRGQTPPSSQGGGAALSRASLPPCPLPLGGGGGGCGGRMDRAATRQVLGDACGRDGECQLFLLTARGSCEVDCPETRTLGWKSASVGPRTERRVHHRLESP